MDAWSINPVDAAVIGLIALSAFLAFWRGFTHEMLGIAAWAGAVILTLQLYPYAIGWTRAWVEMDLLADALAIGGTFVILLLLLGLISSQIGKRVRESAASAIDRSLGFLFGLLRGAVFVSFIFLLIVWLVPPPDQPGFLREARTRPLLERGAVLLLGLLPPGAVENPAAIVGIETAPPPVQGLNPTHRLVAPPARN